MCKFTQEPGELSRKYGGLLLILVPSIAKVTFVRSKLMNQRDGEEHPLVYHTRYPRDGSTHRSVTPYSIEIYPCSNYTTI
jgi:hypothetical protein